MDLLQLFQKRPPTISLDNGGQSNTSSPRPAAPTAICGFQDIPISSSVSNSTSSNSLFGAQKDDFTRTDGKMQGFCDVTQQARSTGITTLAGPATPSTVNNGGPVLRNPFNPQHADVSVDRPTLQQTAKQKKHKNWLRNRRKKIMKSFVKKPQMIKSVEEEEWFRAESPRTVQAPAHLNRTLANNQRCANMPKFMKEAYAFNNHSNPVSAANYQAPVNRIQIDPPVSLPKQEITIKRPINSFDIVGSLLCPEETRNRILPAHSQNGAALVCRKEKNPPNLTSTQRKISSTQASIQSANLPQRRFPSEEKKMTSIALGSSGSSANSSSHKSESSECGDEDLQLLTHLKRRRSSMQTDQERATKLSLLAKQHEGKSDAAVSDSRPLKSAPTSDPYKARLTRQDTENNKDCTREQYHPVDSSRPLRLLQLQSVQRLTSYNLMDYIGNATDENSFQWGCILLDVKDQMRNKCNPIPCENGICGDFEHDKLISCTAKSQTVPTSHPQPKRDCSETETRLAKIKAIKVPSAASGTSVALMGLSLPVQPSAKKKVIRPACSSLIKEIICPKSDTFARKGITLSRDATSDGTDMPIMSSPIDRSTQKEDLCPVTMATDPQDANAPTRGFPENDEEELICVSLKDNESLTDQTCAISTTLNGTEERCNSVPSCTRNALAYSSDVHCTDVCDSNQLDTLNEQDKHTRLCSSDVLQGVSDTHELSMCHDATDAEMPDKADVSSTSDHEQQPGNVSDQVAHPDCALPEKNAVKQLSSSDDTNTDLHFNVASTIHPDGKTVSDGKSIIQESAKVKQEIQTRSLTSPLSNEMLDNVNRGTDLSCSAVTSPGSSQCFRMVKDVSTPTNDTPSESSNHKQDSNDVDISSLFGTEESSSDSDSGSSEGQSVEKLKIFESGLFSSSDDEADEAKSSKRPAKRIPRFSGAGQNSSCEDECDVELDSDLSHINASLNQDGNCTKDIDKSPELRDSSTTELYRIDTKEELCLLREMEQWQEKNLYEEISSCDEVEDTKESNFVSTNGEIKQSEAARKRLAAKRKRKKEKQHLLRLLEFKKRKLYAKEMKKKQHESKVETRTNKPKSSADRGLPVDLSIVTLEGTGASQMRYRGGKKRKKNKSKLPYRPPIKKREKSNEICQYYKNRSCKKGDDCLFSHDCEQSKKPDLCKFYAVGACNQGALCAFMHEEFPCKFFHALRNCRHTVDCKFSHKPLTEETQRMLLESLRMQSSRELELKQQSTPDNRSEDQANYRNVLYTETTEESTMESRHMPSIQR